MLVLTRRKNEIIVIGDIVQVMVVDIKDGKVKLGISAPPEVEVHRLEIYEAIKKSKNQN